MTELEEKNVNNILKNGGVIAFATDTVWGIGCLPRQDAVEKLYHIKERDRTKPLILMSNDISNLLPYLKKLPKKAEELITEHFPGALTIVVEKSELTGDFLTSGLKTVGIRIPNHKGFQNLCSKIDGGVLATTSANLSNQSAARTFVQANEFVGKFVDLIIKDENKETKGLESTVVEVIGDIKILRQGAINI